MSASKRKLTAFQRLSKGEQLSRRDRKQLKRQLYSDDPGLNIVHPNAAGIDVGNDSHFVAVPPGRDEQPVREFGSWTKGVEQLVSWLKSCRINTVAIQSTGVYWVALMTMLEEAGIEVFLVNARHTKNLPGRKSDVQECQWLMKLHTYGLLRNSFHPPEQILSMRGLWRLRDRHVKDAARSIQHMQKALIVMNVQLHNAISDLSGTTGQAIIGAILKGERDPYQLARKYRDPHIRASVEEIARSLEGRWQEQALFELQQSFDSYQFYCKKMSECDEKLNQYLGAMPDKQAPGTAINGQGEAEATEAEAQAANQTQEAGAGKPTGKRNKTGRKKKRTCKTAPVIDLHAEQRRILGVDLTTIPGINVMTVQTILSELGPDLSAFPDEKNFTSWLKLAPKRAISGGKLIRHEKESSRNRVAGALRIAATTLLRSDTYLGARYRFLRTTAGAPKAVKAMARQLACIIYRMICHGEEWVERGAALFEQRRRERELAALTRRAAKLGLALQPLQPASANVESRA